MWIAVSVVFLCCLLRESRGHPAFPGASLLCGSPAYVVGGALLFLAGYFGDSRHLRVILPGSLHVVAAVRCPLLALRNGDPLRQI